MGPLLGCPYGCSHKHTTCVHMGLLYWAYMDPIWACPYGCSHIHTTFAHMSLLARPQMGPIWACPFGRARLHPTKYPYGLPIWVTSRVACCLYFTRCSGYC